MTRKQVVYCLIAVLSVGKSYGQKQLSYFTDQAVKNSPLLKTNAIQSEANKLDAERMAAALTKPVVGTDLNYMLAPVYSNDPGNTGFKLNPKKDIQDYYGSDFSATNGGLYRGVLTLNQPLFNKQRVNAVNEQTAVLNEILSNNSELSKRDLEKLVTDQYILCLQDNEQQQAVQNIIEVIEQQISLTKKLSANGLGRQGDYKVLEIELKQQSTALQTFKNNYRIHLLELYSLCGIPDTQIVEIMPLSLEMSVPRNANQQSGFTKQYQLDSLNIAASKKMFDTKYRPDISLYSSAGLNAVYAPDIYKRVGWQVGIRFTQILFDGHQRKLNDQKTCLLQETANINRVFLNTKNEMRKKALLELIQSIDEQLQSIQLQIVDYNTLLSYYQKQVAAGQNSVIDYITVLRSSAS
ncbi:MAG: hypothetical protein DI539_29785, partial [Flavobacterium psychrophilum]